eukprot:CAMPEP_0202442360 /NCGR_PEP_ID=MMETSP1360-20130828/1814_1 /ASSEMBLY_ACC=CAM_ASM_000848 /TAXON_ID=515479 /ORGANISM="Licmophora paradoxa, Strain CCMP2313" /LENGTH=524 /DNA_ID=CAMNT_0049057705 /DNA_START=1 /DNA_END=1575 /DNA_ORIENTATION=-
MKESPSFLENELATTYTDSMATKTGCSSGTRVLCANLEAGTGSPFHNLVTSGTISPSHIVTFGEEQVGIVGVSNRTKAMRYDIGANTTLLDERTQVEQEIETLKSKGINKIILLTHIGYDTDLMWAAELEDIDIIVGGDSHALMGDRNVADPLLEAIVSQGGEGEYIGRYPTPYRNSAGKLVCIVQAWEHAKAVGKLDVSFDADGSVLSCGGKTVIPYEIDANVPEKKRSQIAEYLNSNQRGNMFVETEKDPTTSDVLASYEVQLQKSDHVIGTVLHDICYARIPGTGLHSKICSVEDTSKQGGGVGNLVAQGILNQIPGADISIQNAGGCMGDIREGNFTVLDGKNLLPFSNSIVTLRMTGSQIKNVLESAISRSLSDPDLNDGAYPYAAGIRFVVNEDADDLDRLDGLEVNSRLEDGQWSALNMTMTYVVATNSFLGSGKDGYVEFGNIEGDNRYDSGEDYTGVFLQYVENVGVLLDPSLDTYSTQSFVSVTLSPSTVPTMSLSPSMDPSSSGGPTGVNVTV